GSSRNVAAEDSFPKSGTAATSCLSCGLSCGPACAPLICSPFPRSPVKCKWPDRAFSGLPGHQAIQLRRESDSGESRFIPKPFPPYDVLLRLSRRLLVLLENSRLQSASRAEIQREISYRLFPFQ